jgi:hypothetical protein
MGFAAAREPVTTHITQKPEAPNKLQSPQSLTPTQCTIPPLNPDFAPFVGFRVPSQHCFQ